jgi:hypothetical protein
MSLPQFGTTCDAITKERFLWWHLKQNFEAQNTKTCQAIGSLQNAMKLNAPLLSDN